jgi:hypothetical protein
METTKYRFDIKIGTLHANIPLQGELLVVLKDGILSTFTKIFKIIEDVRVLASYSNKKIVIDSS